MRRGAIVVTLVSMMVATPVGLAGAAAADAAPPVETAPSVPDAVPVVPPQTEGPMIVLDDTEVEIGDAIIVSLFRFASQQATISVCGNLGKRGSSDCNMPFSQSERIRANQEVTLTQLFVQTPPVACPCIVRAAGVNGEFAVAPIRIIDHPVGAVVTPTDEPLVEVTIGVERSVAGFFDSLKSQLAGPTTYDVTVTVRNVTTEVISSVRVQATATHRLGDDVAPMSFDAPGPLDPGQTWSQTVQASIPAPVIGGYDWTVTASGAGSIVEAHARHTARPIALFVLVGVLILDILVLVGRFIARRVRRARGRGDRKPDLDGHGPDAQPVGPPRRRDELIDAVS